jgi:hypothetical protein
MTEELKNARNEALAKAKAKLVAELLTNEEENIVSGGRTDGGSYWQDFTKFVMAQ